jgi:HPt (histidine-containing phosphotransfer) domain-containing protein
MRRLDFVPSMSKPDAENPLFDESAIERLRKVAGDQGATFVTEMAQLFLHESRKSVADIRKGCAAGDWKQVTRLAHSLKSSAATLGLMRLSAACKALEADTRGSVHTAATPALAKVLFDEFDQAVPILEDLS